MRNDSRISDPQIPVNPPGAPKIRPTDLQSVPAVCDACQLTGVEAGSELGLAWILVVAQRLSGSTH